MRAHIITLGSFTLALILILAGTAFSVYQYPPIKGSGEIVYLRYLHTIYESGGVYYSANPTGGIEYQSSYASNVINWAIWASPDNANILVTDGTYTIYSTITDQGKNGITIEGESWDSKIVVVGTINGFYIQSRKDWVFRNFKIEGTKSVKGQSGFENAHFRLKDCSNITIDHIWSRTANGYSVKPADFINPTYNVNIKVINCFLDDPGHNCLSTAGLNGSLIQGNYMIKVDQGVDMELLWIGGDNIGGVLVGSYFNKILDNTMIGGSIAVSLACWTTNNPKYVAYNLVSGNFINATNDYYPVIYLRSWYNNITDNTIYNYNTARSSYIISLETQSGDSPNFIQGNKIINNKIYHKEAVGIGAYAVQVMYTDIINNRIFWTPFGTDSISISNPRSDYITCTGNVVRRTIEILGNAHGIVANNTENVPD